MKKPFLIVGLMLAATAAVIGTVVVVGNRTPKDFRDSVSGLKVPTKFPTHDLKDSADTTPVDIPVASKTGPWPKIAFDDTTYAFGSMAVNAKNEHTFTIRNEGDADLIMKEGKATCKCTTFSVETKILKPGEQTKLVIDWHAGSGPDRSFSHGGPVYTNDPENPSVNFVVQGAIERPIELLPEFWSAGNIGLEKQGTLRAAIGSRLTDAFEVESVESPSGKVTVNVTPLSIGEIASEKLKTGYRLEIHIAADIPVGKFEEDVKINLKGIDRVPFVTAKLTARKFGNFILQPLDGAMFVPDKLVLQLGQFPASEGRKVRLLLIADEKDMSEPFQITEIEADPPFLKASIEQLGNPTGTVHRYAVEISVPPGRPHVHKTDNKRGHIRIHTNHPSKETIETEILMHSH